MTDTNDTAGSRYGVFIITVVILLSFALLTGVLLSGFRVRSAIDRTGMGVFDEETVQRRVDNLATTKEEQAKVYSEEKVEAAMEKVVAELSKKEATKTEMTVPGSPTFLPQSAAPAETTPAEAAPAPKPGADGAEPGTEPDAGQDASKGGSPKSGKPKSGGKAETQAPQAPGPGKAKQASPKASQPKAPAKAKQAAPKGKPKAPGKEASGKGPGTPGKG